MTVPLAKESTVDVLVIGAGPAGLMAANALASAGVNVRIIDQRYAHNTLCMDSLIVRLNPDQQRSPPGRQTVSSLVPSRSYKLVHARFAETESSDSICRVMVSPNV